MRIDSDPHTLYRQVDGIRAEQPRAEAVVRKTKAGFDLGIFGISYESEEVRVDERHSPGARAARRLTREFETAGSVKNLRAEVADKAVDSRVNWAQSLPTGQTAATRQGMAAYARSLQPEYPLPGSSLTIVA